MVLLSEMGTLAGDFLSCFSPCMTLQQPSLTTLAKQGDFAAIAALMNRALQPKGIVVRVAHQNGHLRVLLEGQTIPDQKVLAPYVYKGISTLQIPKLHTLGILGRVHGTSTSAWSETFALTTADLELSTKPPTHLEPDNPDRKQTLDPSESESQGEDDLIDNPENNSTGESDVASVANLDTIATHLNQALATEGLVFEASLDDRILRLTAKTNQILEGDTFAKAVQTLLLPLNVSDIDKVQLYKQKTTSNTPYKIKEFTLYREQTQTEAVVNVAESLPLPDRPAAQVQPTKLTSQAAKQSKFVMIALVALFVVVLIGGIKLLAKPPAAAEVCQDAAGAPGYCQLAVQMTGEQTLHNLKTVATPLTLELQEKGLSFCTEDSNLQLQRKLGRQKTRYTPAFRSEPLFPGIMMVDTQLKASPQSDVTVFRTACLFVGNGNQVELFKNVVLPNGWPQEPYQGQQELEPMQRSLKAYQIIILLGGGTLFTAIGLFAASILNLGFQIYSFGGLWRTASILGTLDTLLLIMSGATLNLFGGVPLTCLALGLTQMWVKDLRVDWAAGYRVVALGVFLMMIIRTVLNWLLLGFIFSVL